MKRFTIPLIYKWIDIYEGADEWEKFKRDTVKAGANRSNAQKELPSNGSGRMYGSYIWISDEPLLSTLFHELSHVLDAIMEYLGTNDSEFRAYLAGWIFTNVFAWFRKKYPDARD